MKDKKDKTTKKETGGTEPQLSQQKGFLRLVEDLGNKLPHPFWIFIGLCVVIVVTSFVAAWIGLSATNPSTGEVVEAVNLLSAAGFQRFLEEMVTNFAHFEPVGLVLVMLMGVSIAEKSGLLAALMRSIAFKVPRAIVFPVIFILAACGNIGSDAGVVIIPPIAAIVFSKMGYHPVAGLVVGYAGATAGFTANFFIAGTDVLLAGISSQVTSNISEGLAVSATSNWFFMIASTFVLAFGGAFIAKRFTIPQTAHFSRADDLLDAPQEETSKKVSDLESKGMRRAGIAALIIIALLLIALIPAGGILREPGTGSIVPSPFLRGLIPILFFFFAITGYVYGKAVGVIKKPDDAIKQMEDGLQGLTGYLVLMLVVAQFIELFQWSRLDTILAISGANFLETTGLLGAPLFVVFILIVAVINIFMGSGSAKWAIFAPIFIPMLYQLGYNPAFVQLLYRIGDSITNGISPLYPYFPFLLGMIKKHDKRAGIGTVVSLLMPYAGLLLVLWLVLLFIWTGLDLPIGVGEGIYLK
jgi:aminobenzoyl-glutamate transport protein